MPPTTLSHRMSASGKRSAPEAIFPRLQSGTASPAPERVAAHQRGRLMGAMVEAVERSGYPQVTVQELVGLAGISKSDFYRHFDSKQACFLATFEETVRQGSERVVDAYRAGTGLAGSLESGLKGFMQAVATEPAAATLVMVESLALGAAGVSSREAAAAPFEALVAESFAKEEMPLSSLQCRAVVAGWRHVAFRGLRRGETSRLSDDVPALVSWALSYRRAAEFAVPSLVPLPVKALPWSEPPGGKLARRQLSQRDRILRAVAQIAAENGYKAVTIPAVSARAGTSNETWYQHFDSKREAFLAAFEELVARALVISAAEFERQEDWATGIAAGLAALLAHIASEPIFARLAFFELPAWPGGIDRAEGAIDALAEALRPASFDARARELPEVTRHAIVGGIWAAIQHELADRRASSLPALAAQLAALALVPFEA